MSFEVSCPTWGWNSRDWKLQSSFYSLMSSKGPSSSAFSLAHHLLNRSSMMTVASLVCIGLSYSNYSKLSFLAKVDGPSTVSVSYLEGEWWYRRSNPRYLSSPAPRSWTRTYYPCSTHLSPWCLHWMLSQYVSRRLSRGQSPVNFALCYSEVCRTFWKSWPDRTCGCRFQYRWPRSWTSLTPSRIGPRSWCCHSWWTWVRSGSSWWWLASSFFDRMWKLGELLRIL